MEEETISIVDESGNVISQRTFKYYRINECTINLIEYNLSDKRRSIAALSIVLLIILALIISFLIGLEKPFSESVKFIILFTSMSILLPLGTLWTSWAEKKDDKDFIKSLKRGL